MEKAKHAVSNVDSYIASFPAHTQTLLNKLRSLIIKAAPEAEEIISYQMPAYKFHGQLVFFAAYERHIGFYPTPSGIENFKNELAVYKTAKGSVQFPLDKPLPVKLITMMVKFRVEQNLEKAKLKLKA